KAVAVEVEAAQRIGGAVNFRAIASDADGDGAEAAAGIADGPSEDLILSIVLIELRAAEGDDRGGRVIVRYADSARGGAGQIVIGAVAVGVGGRDVHLVGAKAVAVEAEAAAGVGRAVYLGAIPGDAD